MADPLTCQEINCPAPNDYEYSQQSLPPAEPVPIPTPPTQTTLPFDYTACNGIVYADPVVDGGGDTFDCYPVGDATDLPAPPGIAKPTMIGGNGFTGAWVIGSNPFGEAFGDLFEEYPDGAVLTGTLSGGTGLSGTWSIGDGP